MKCKTNGYIICRCCRQGLGFTRRCICEASWVTIKAVPAAEFAVDTSIISAVDSRLSILGLNRAMCCNSELQQQATSKCHGALRNQHQRTQTLWEQLLMEYRITVMAGHKARMTSWGNATVTLGAD